MDANVVLENKQKPFIFQFINFSFSLLGAR